MVTENHFVVGCAAFPIMNTTRVLPGPGSGISPAKVAFSEFQNPSVIETLKLLGHVISDMPDSRPVLVVYLTVVPDL